KRSGFLFFVWLAFALGGVAVIEPSPSDVSLTLLAVVGFFTAQLTWGRTLTVPLMLLGFFVLANLASLCYAVEPAQGAAYLGVTLFMLVSWLFTTGLVARHGERALRAVMTAYTAGGVVTTTLAVAAYFHLVSFGADLLYYDRVKGFFKDPNVFGPYLVVVAVYAISRLQARESRLLHRLWWLVSCLIAVLGVLLRFS